MKLLKIFSITFKKAFNPKYLFLVFFLSLVQLSVGQELNSTVTVNYQQVQGSNLQIFKTLETSLIEFLNQTKWTNKVVQPSEKINCSFTIIVTSREDNRFTATLQVQSSRPVYGSSYESPLLNIRDESFDFTYNEFEPLLYNRNAFDSNLVSTIVFYAYIILGVDADSFKKFGGEAELKEAENVMLQAQQSGISSWQNVVGKQNRFLLIDNLLSPNLKLYREVMYDYHRLGMDYYTSNEERGKTTVEKNVISLEQLFNKTVGNYLLRIFFDAKANEIVNIYSGGYRTRFQGRLVTILKKISPNNSSKWANIEQ
ncbi:MAG: DUF4835 domain-containing protein [Flavobacteriaceae bacterium]|nr:DUF4835 domain-containing protein [Flavobacteriaceae bacterium]|tara:strand:+ start:71669 stop:72607 length:939 start_codon:yes stop_codon:yes gene_type:complete